MLRRYSYAVAVVALIAPLAPARAQTVAPDSVPAILAPRRPIPPEAATAGIRRFSFIAYGDTRGRHDGVELQAEHQLVIEAMLNTMKRATHGRPTAPARMASGGTCHCRSGARSSPGAGAGASSGNRWCDP